jgi:hypothetical protein
MNKHTPGPWHWVIQDRSMATLGVGQDPGIGDPHVLSVSPCKSCEGISENWEWGKCLTPSESDANLIAASPDLLAACQAMIEWDNEEKSHRLDFYARMELCQRAFDLARAAIAKATGAQP